MKKSKGRIVVNIISGIILFAILILAVLLFIAKISGDIVFVFDRSMMWVMTNSMEDEIPAQSYIVVHKVTDPATLKVGDVISFYSDDPVLQGNLNTHRIIEIVDGENGLEFVTKGDHNLVKDEYTAKGSKVIAKYERTLPVLSALGRFFLTGFGVITLVVVGVVVCAIFIVPDFIKAAKSESKKYKDEESEEDKAAREKYIEESVRKEVERMMAEDAKKKSEENAADKSATEE